MSPCTQHCVAEALRVALTNEVDVGEVAGVLDLRKLRAIALLQKVRFKFWNRVKVVREVVLVSSDDDQDVGDAGVYRLLNDILNSGLVNNRQHFLRHRLCSRKETRTKACRRNDSLEWDARHAPMLAAPPDPPLLTGASGAPTPRIRVMSRDLDDAKRALRAELRERRAILSESQREDAAAALTTRLDALVAATGARSISCFLSYSTEPDTRAFIEGALARGIRVLLPISREDGLLDWAVATDSGDVADGLFGIPEPQGELLGPIAVGDVDLMIIPAAAVDSAGMRLGWGRGFFDKTLGSIAKCPPAYAVVYDSEVLDEVPSDQFDQPVSGVVTPLRTLTFSSR